jgi:hypothetical protein
VVVDGAAAGLRAGDDNIAAILLEDAGGGPVHVSEHGVGDAAHKQADSGAAFADGGEEFREFGWEWFEPRELGFHPLEFLWEESGESEFSGGAVESEVLQESGWEEGKAETVTRGEESVKNPAMEPVGLWGCCGRLLTWSLWLVLHFDAEWFEQSAVLDSAGAGSFAAAAIEAGVEVATNGGCEGEPLINDCAHEVDATAGAVVFVAGFDIGGAGRGAESAVDAVKEAFVGDGLTDDRQRGGRCGCGGLGHGADPWAGDQLEAGLARAVWRPLES